MTARTRQAVMPAALFVLALAVRLAWMPTWERLAFDGHERYYLRAFEGQRADPSAAVHPAMSAIYGVLGMLSDDPRALVVFSALLGAMAVVGVAVWTRRRFGPEAGAWAGLLVALLGEHAASSTSAYHVILPHALLVWAFLLPGGWAALLLGLATWIRPELAVVGVFRGWPALAMIPGVAGWLMLPGPVVSPGGFEAPVVPSDPILALRVNWRMVRFLGPPVLALGALSGRWRLLGVALLVHLTGALFDDYGARHALIGGVLLCVAVGVAAQRWGGLVAIVAAVGLSVDTAAIAEAWNARVDLASDLPPLDPDCIEITEEPPIPGQLLPSHFRFFAGEWQDACVVWGEEGQHRRWSSRGLRDRALRMRTLYDLDPVAAKQGPPATRIYWRVHRSWP